MSTLAEIEAAMETLPRPQQLKLMARLAAKLDRPHHRKTQVNLHQRMKDLCGIVDSGIPDLATNKAHMEGFGRSRR